MLCSTKTNIVLLKICWTKNAPRAPPPPQKCSEWMPMDSQMQGPLTSWPCALQGALVWRVAVGVGAETPSPAHPLGSPYFWHHSRLLQTAPLLSLRVTPLPGACLGPLCSQGNSAGQQCQRLSEPELADCILENSMCVFFPCNLTLGRDSLIGIAS